MDQQRDPPQTDEPVGEPPDEGLAYDPAMTDADEANIPPDSTADPTGSDESEDA
jgi:hypothetical protein